MLFLLKKRSKSFILSIYTLLEFTLFEKNVFGFLRVYCLEVVSGSGVKRCGGLSGFILIELPPNLKTASKTDRYPELS